MWTVSLCGARAAVRISNTAARVRLENPTTHSASRTEFRLAVERDELALSEHSNSLDNNQRGHFARTT
jgi:hypothetical protein